MLYTVPTTRVPKFRRLNKIYPLRSFAAYLTSRGASASVIPGYVSTMRQLLGALMEGETVDGVVQKRRWLDHAAVEAYASSLPRRRLDLLRCVWRFWCDFTNIVDPLDRSVAYSTVQSVVVAAAQTLLANSGKAGMPRLEQRDLPRLFWVHDWRDSGWYVAKGRDGTDRFLPGPGVRVLCNVIHRWGHPAGRQDGAPFLPREQGSMDPMSSLDIAHAFRVKVPAEVAAWLAKAMEEDIERARAALPVPVVPAEITAAPPPNRTQPKEERAHKVVRAVADTSDESFGKTMIIDGKLVVENPEDDGLPDWMK